MARPTRGAAATIAVVAAVAVGGCGKASAPEEGGESEVSVEPIKGSDLKRITLTEIGAQRIGIRTVPVRRSARKLAIPYAAVMYGPEGDAFAYTSPKPLTFVRQPLTIDRLSARLAYLRKGPPPGTPVVTVGAAELLGNEEGVQED